MAASVTPFGLKPYSMQGGQSFTGGTIREIKLSTNNATAMFNGDIIQLTAAGNPQPLTATPTTATAGVIGVCVGARFVDPILKQQLFAQFVPANAITSGYTEVYVRVVDDPDQLYLVQAATAVGTLTNGAFGAIGKNGALGNFGGSTTTGNSTINLVSGTNWASLASTNTFAVRVVDIVTPSDAIPELVIKFNQGVHSYYAPLGV
jgi:hypothetical protein